MQTYHTVPLPPGPVGLRFSKARASPFKLRIISIAEWSPLVGQVQPFDIVDHYDGVATSHSFDGIANAELLKKLLATDETLDSRILVLRREDELIPLYCMQTTIHHSDSKDAIDLHTSKYGSTLAPSHQRGARVIQFESVDENSPLFGRVKPGDYISSAICIDGHETTDDKMISRALMGFSSSCQAIRLVRARWIPIPAIWEEDLGVAITGSPPTIYYTTNKDDYGLHEGQEVLSMKLPSGEVVVPSTEHFLIYFGDNPRPILNGYSILVGDAAVKDRNQAGPQASTPPQYVRQEKHFGSNTTAAVLLGGMSLIFACIFPLDERPVAEEPRSRRRTVVRI